MRLKMMAKGAGFPRREAKEELGKEGEVLAARAVGTEPEKTAQARLGLALVPRPPWVTVHCRPSEGQVVSAPISVACPPLRVWHGSPGSAQGQPRESYLRSSS